MLNWNESILIIVFMFLSANGLATKYFWIGLKKIGIENVKKIDQSISTKSVVRFC